MAPAGKASVAADALTSIDDIAASPDGDRLCLVERGRGRLWELTLAAGVPLSVALIADDEGARACGYGDGGELAWMSAETLHAPWGEVDLALEGLSRPAALVALPDGYWLAGDLDTSARCFHATERTLETGRFQVAAIDRPLPDAAVWVDPTGRVFADRAASLCTPDFEPAGQLCHPRRTGPRCVGATDVELCCPIGVSIPTAALPGFGVRRDGVMFWRGWRIRPPYPDSVPGASGWYRPPLTDDLQDVMLYTHLGRALYGEPGGMAVLPGGTFPADYALAGEPDGLIKLPPDEGPEPSPDAGPESVAERRGGGDEGCASGSPGGAVVCIVSLLGLLARARWRRVMITSLATFVAMGSAACGSSDTDDPVDAIGGTAPTGGTGPANVEPLFPMRPGSRLTGFGMPGAFKPTTLTPGLSDWGDGSLQTVKRLTLGNPEPAGNHLDFTAAVPGLARYTPDVSAPPFTAPDVIEGRLPMFFLDKGGRTALSWLDFADDRVTPPVVGPTLVGTVVPRTTEGSRDLLLITNGRAGTVDELRYDGERAWIERVGTVDLPRHHTLVGVARAGGQDLGGLVVATASLEPREPGDLAPDRRRGWLWRAEIPDDPQPDAPAAPGLTVVARTSALDVRVCWAAGQGEPDLDPAKWILAGAPAAAVLALDGDAECVLVLRDPSAWQGAPILEGPIPGVGRMLIRPEAAWDPELPAIPLGTSALSADYVTDEALLPVVRRGIFGVKADFQDSTGAGAWGIRFSSAQTESDTTFALLRPDGTEVDADGITVPRRPGGNLTLFASSHRIGGGIVVKYADGGAGGFYAVDLDGTTTTLTVAGRPHTVAVQTDGTVCGAGDRSFVCRLPDGTERIVDVAGDFPRTLLEPLPDGRFLVTFPEAYATYDSATDTLTRVDGAGVVRVVWGPDEQMLIALSDGTWLEATDGGLVAYPLPATPADAGPVIDYVPLRSLHVVVTQEAVFRIPR